MNASSAQWIERGTSADAAALFYCQLPCGNSERVKNAVDKVLEFSLTFGGKNSIMKNQNFLLDTSKERFL